jgi:TPR repeat protein
VKWLRKAAEQNFALAQNNLGLCYGNGQGVAKDAVEGVKWLRKAAEQNLALAQHNLGFCYSQGQGVAKDAVEAVKWWRKAAWQNFAEALFNLGACYANGQGVVKDAVEAYKWMLLAAEQGSKTAKEFIPEVGRQLTQGQLAEGQKRARQFKPAGGTALNARQGAVDDTPLADLRAKAESGDATAQSQLGLRYERGDGVAKYEVEALKWHLVAAAQGDPKAKLNASVLELLLLPEEIAEGKRRAQDWLEQHKKSSSSKR